MRLKRCVRRRSDYGLGVEFRFSQFFGILPFTNEGQFSKALWFRSVSLLIYLIFTVFPAEIYDYVKKFPGRRTLVKKLIASMYFLHRPVSFAPIVLHVFNSYKSRESLKKVLKYLLKFRNKKNELITVFILVWIITSDINFVYFRTAVKTWADVLNSVRRISLFAVFLYNTFIIALYSGFLYHLERRLIVARSAIKINVRLAISEHTHILELCQIIDSCFGPQLLVLTLDSAYSVISSAYFITSLFFFSEYATYRKISEKVFFVVSLAYIVGYPANRCEKVKHAAEAFNDELFKVMQDSEDLCNHDELRLYVLMKMTVDFTACGFFKLGYPLVKSIIAAATTYLVVLVDNSLENKQF